MSAKLPVIGGTKAADIMGVGYRSPLECWSELTGRIEPKDLSENEAVQAGIWLEPAVKQWFTARTGIAVMPGCLVPDPHFSWIAGNTDGFTTNDGTTRAMVYEGKTTHGLARKDWRTTDDPDSDVVIPLRFQVQGQLYLRCSGLAAVQFAALVGGNHLEHPVMYRDDRFIAAMIGELERFWNEHVVKDVPPKATAQDLGVLRNLYPVDRGAIVTFPADSPEDDAMIRFVAANAARREAENDENAAKAALQQAMKDATTLRTPAGCVTWKAQRSEYKAQPARVVETRVFRVSQRRD